VVEPKFIRDAMDVKDIVGATPSQRFAKPARMPMQLAEIDGSSPKRLIGKADKSYNLLDYSDVTGSRSSSKLHTLNNNHHHAGVPIPKEAKMSRRMMAHNMYNDIFTRPHQITASIDSL